MPPPIPPPPPRPEPVFAASPLPRAAGQAHLLLSSQEQDVRQRPLDRIADLAAALPAQARCLGPLLPEIAQVARIDQQISGDRSAQRLVGGDQQLQSLIDLAVHPLTPLLHGHHQQQPDADADQREKRHAQKGGQGRLP